MMAGLQSCLQHPRFCFIICVSAAFLFMHFSQELRSRLQEERHRRNFNNFTEIPAENIIDPTAIDLTPLVNTLINSSQSGSRQLFSLLSVTSYSSLDLHKLTLLVYNISSIKSLESSLFRRRFCYCVTNETNDLTDFTAILLDVMGNSSSYLHELFKSSSILSVSQRNNSDCIYICVMAGKMGREVSGLWDVGSVTPLFNQTIVEGPHKVTNISFVRLPIEWNQLPTNLSHASPSGTSSMYTSQVSSTAIASSHLSRTSSTTLKVTASETVATPRYPTYSVLPGITAESPSTVRRPETANSWTSHRFTTPESRTTQSATTPAAGTGSQTSARTTRRPTTVVRVQTAATAGPRLTLPPPTATTALSALMNLVETRTSSRETPLHTTSMRPSSPRPAEQLTETTPGRATTSSGYRETEKPGCPWRRLEPGGRTMTVGELKLQPCVLELCKFFSQCLCRPFSQKTRAKRYCDDSFLWYEEHTFEVCRRVKRVSFSRNLKQRCLSKMCSKL
ncbi:HERV-H LTR-associating protein 1 isoform 1-T1 [Fundulus diaphanus]